MLSYLGSSRFWFESLQNRQSEFLAIGSLIVLSIVPAAARVARVEAGRRQPLGDRS